MNMESSDGKMPGEGAPDWAAIHAALRCGHDISRDEAEKVVGALASALTLSTDSRWPQELDLDDAWDTLRFVRPCHQAVASAWAGWVRANIARLATSDGLERWLSRPPFEYALRAIARTGYAGSEVWEALEAVAQLGGTTLVLQAVVCASDLGAGTAARDRAAALLVRAGRSRSAALPVKVEAWWRLVRLQGLRRGIHAWRSAGV